MPRDFEPDFELYNKVHRELHCNHIRHVIYSSLYRQCSEQCSHYDKVLSAVNVPTIAVVDNIRQSLIVGLIPDDK